MKHLHLILCMIAALAIASCSNDEPVLNIAEKSQIQAENISAIRTVEEAIEIASKNYVDVFQANKSRTFSINHNNVVVFDSNKASRSAASDTAIYVVNFGDNEGFAVVSAKRNCTPLLAITDNGQINNIEDIEIPGLKAFMEGAIAYSSLPPIDGPTLPDKQMFVQLTDTIVVNYGPNVTVTWGQNWPEGYFCPNKSCGCVVTATVQALSYYELPNSINLTYPSRDVNYQLLSWPSMKKSIKSYSYYPTYFDMDSIALGHHYGLARLCREIGYRINADYSEYMTTGASVWDLLPVLRQLAPQLTISDFTEGSPDAAKNNWEIIMMAGWKGVNENGRYIGGHAWIIDGYKSKKLHYRDYFFTKPAYDIYGNPIVSGEPFAEYDVVSYSLSHINWGWNGHGNGYYDVGVFDTTKCKELDDEASYSQYNFQYYTHYCTILKK